MRYTVAHVYTVGFQHVKSSSILLLAVETFQESKDGIGLDCVAKQAAPYSYSVEKLHALSMPVPWDALPRAWCGLASDKGQVLRMHKSWEHASLRALAVLQALTESAWELRCHTLATHARSAALHNCQHASVSEIVSVRVRS